MNKNSRRKYDAACRNILYRYYPNGGGVISDISSQIQEGREYRDYMLDRKPSIKSRLLWYTKYYRTVYQHERYNTLGF